MGGPFGGLTGGKGAGVRDPEGREKFTLKGVIFTSLNFNFFFSNRGNFGVLLGIKISWVLGGTLILGARGV